MNSKWAEIASATVGTEFGHVPGHHFHDVEVTIAGRRAKYRVDVEETSGSAQGYDEVHERRRVVAIDEDLDAAVSIASARGQTAGIDRAYLVQALSQAHADALDADLDDRDE